MRKIAIACGVLFVAPFVCAQAPQERYRMMLVNRTTESIQADVKDAIRKFGEDRKIFARDLAVLDHVRSAAEALSNEMQRTVAVEKAWEEIKEADRLLGDPRPDFRVQQGVLRARQAVEGALRSPTSADLDRLQTTIRTEAVRPARDVVAENARVMQEETLAWLRIQELISTHLRDMAEFTRENLEQTH